ncbi:MAG: lysophospholipase [Planctomycetota bacterium]|nr:lysophospholipase [Planctomycetota bacterium]
MSTSPAPTALAVEEQQLRSADQTALWTRRVRPEGQSRARVAFVHGFAEHGGRYVPTLRWFAARGCEAYALDLRGHGRSGGRRTFVRRWGDFLDDVEAYLLHVAAHGEGPLFLVGHSMGGLVVARTLQERRHRLPALRGAVLTSPFLKVKMPLPAWKTAAGRVLSRWLPWFRIPADLDVAQLSRDLEVGRAYLADPLVERGATARWYTEAMAAQEAALATASALDLPLLFMHGEDDGVVDVEGTRRLHAAAASQDKELRLWPGARHELFNETNKEEVWAHLLGWVERRLS